MVPHRPLMFAALAALSIGACDCSDGSGLGTVQASIIVDPNPIDFGEVWVGTLFRKTLTMRNAGSVGLQVTSTQLAIDSGPGLAVDDYAGGLAPSAAATTEVRLRAAALGSITGAVIIRSDDPGTPELRVPIVATVVRKPGPSIGVCVKSDDIPLAQTCEDPLRIDFGAVPFGQTKVATITIRSVGTEPLSVTKSEAHPGGHPTIEFAPPMFSGTLAPDATQTITVSFSPAGTAEVSAVHQTDSNDADTSFVPVIITASGIAPALCPSASAVDFGTVQIGQHADRTVTLESCGTVPVRLDALSIFGANSEFSITSTAAVQVSLQPGETYDVALRYAPINPGQDTDRLQIDSSLPTGFIELVGEAATCDLQVTPPAIDFGAVATGSSRQRAVLVENIGAAECQVTAIGLTAATSAEFTAAMPGVLPFALSGGQSVTVDLEYTPTDAGTDMGTLEIGSTDQAEPVTQVALTGRRLGIGECNLVATPDPLAFGAVPIGLPTTRTIQIMNAGASRCTILNIAASAATSASFTVMPSQGIPWILQAGASRGIDVIYEPQSTIMDTGAVEIFGINPITPTMSIPITGSGSGPKLCVEPTPVVFGTHAVGARVQRQVRIISCGTEDLIVSNLNFPAPTSAEFSFATSPALPMTIAAGADTILELAYQSVDMGRDDGILRIDSNDVVNPRFDVDLIAAAGDACGDIQGKICGLGGLGPVAGATVYVDLMGQRYQATTNRDGDYVITCVPPGTHTVTAESGNWSTSFPALVNPNQVTSIPGQMCLDPTSAEVAVVTGQWDAFEDILDRLSVPYTLYDDGSWQGADRLLLDATELARYDIVFLNCGYDESSSLTPTGLTNLRNFVDNGGSVYASDWAYDVLERAWPAAVDYLGDDTQIGAAQTAGNFASWVDVVEASLVTALGGRTRLQISSCCTAVDNVPATTDEYLRGDRLNDGGMHPLFVGFEPNIGSGRVYYTDFHNQGQQHIDTVFRWLINRL